MVVEVLMISCQVSEKPKAGPETAQNIMTKRAATKVSGAPAKLDTAEENL